ncbi:MAG: diguanylate cyclase [Deltaproteobacteria bacterium]|nr:diguanylate cyclase [Deltaproteobacteria bacterium]
MAAKKEDKKRFLQVSRLNSIKTRIIVFALLATIIPSVSMGWLSYVQNRKFLNQKIKQELRVVTSQASRELDLWLKDRLYDVRVFSSSYVVLENLDKIVGQGGAHIENVVALRRLKDYLRSVREKIVDYQELMLLDLKGKIVATSAKQATTVKLPDKWLPRAQANKHTIGQPHWDETLQAGVVVVTQPIRTANERLLGVLAAKINFRTIGKTLKNYAQGEIGELYLITGEGILLVSSRTSSAKFLETKLVGRTTRKLFFEEGDPQRYYGYHGEPVVGALKRMSELDWGVVAEKERAKAYAQIVRLRNVTLVLVVGLLLFIGLGAYLLGLTLVRPLDRLTGGASKVAAGDLEVDLPVLSGSEVGYLTEVFNDMVARLRQGREELAAINKTLRKKNKELHELSITDSLTGLYNRKHLMETLENEVARSKRHEHDFAVLVVDIDDFKEYNDTYGHLAGDEVLSRLASVFKKSVRSCDYVARYGGEEFILVLPESGPKDGVQAAERLRKKVVKEKFAGDGKPRKVTVSVGVASYPTDGDEPQAIIRHADAALYKAKESGRNQVVLAGETPKKKKQKSKSKGKSKGKTATRGR